LGDSMGQRERENRDEENKERRRFDCFYSFLDSSITFQLVKVCCCCCIFC
jgi:hypothetical protein